MRIAVSGSHGTGKTTLIDAFARRHPGYATEPEPYVALVEMGEVFADPPALPDYERQLEFNLEVLRLFKAGDDVIFERSPFDFLAYMVAVAGEDSIAHWIAPVRSAVPHLDAVVFLPIDAAIEIPESEDLLLRDDVDDLLQQILLEDRFDLFSGCSPILVEARGTVDQRLLTLETLLRQ